MLRHVLTWNEIPGWFDFEDIYLEAVRRAEDGHHFVEIGSCWGKSTSYLAYQIRKSGKNIHLDAVDVWGLNARYIWEWYMYRTKLLDQVNPVHMDSVSASALYEEESLDFIFIDADHSYKAVISDLNAWYPKLRPGCVVAGHDYNQGWPGVIQAVDEFFVGKANHQGNSWVYRKPQEN